MTSSRQTRKPIKRRILRLAVFLGVLFGSFLLVITAIFYAKRVWILEQVQSYANEAQSGELKIEKMELALLKHLPNVTIKLTQIRYYEHRDSVREDVELPIVSARDLHVAFEPWQLLRYNNLKVSEVSIEEGVINLVEYEDNTLNLERALASPQGKPRSNPSIDESIEVVTFSGITLKSVELTNIAMSYQNPTEGQSSKANITYLEGELLLSDTGLDVDLLSDFQITSSSKRPALALLGPIGIDVNLTLVRTSQQLVMHKGTMTVGEILIQMNGTYDHYDDQKVDLIFDASSSGFKLLAKIVHEETLKRNRSQLQNAEVVLRGRVYGNVRHRAPLADLTFAVKNVNLKLQQDAGDFKEVGFEGEFHTGHAVDFSEASLTVKNLNGSIPGGHLSGHFMCTNFQNPYLKYDLDLKLLLNGYDEVFRIQEIDDLTGTVELKAKFDGPLELRKQLHTDSLSTWSLDVDDVGFTFLPTGKEIRHLSGNISELSNEVVLSNLRMEYDSSDLLLNGAIKNLYRFIFNKENAIEAVLNVKSDQLYTSHLIRNIDHKPMVDDRISNLKFDVSISSDTSNVNENFSHFHVKVDDMSFEMDKLPGVSKMNTIVDVYKSQGEINVKLHDFHAEMAHGMVDIAGHVSIPDDVSKIDIEAKIGMTDFPWTYVSDLINEMRGKDLVGARNMKPTEMEIWNSNLDLSTTIEPRPFALSKLELRESSLSMLRIDSQYYEFKNASLQLNNLHFLHELESNRIVGLKSGACELTINSLLIPAIKKSAVDLKLNVVEDKYDATFSMLSELADSENGTLFWDRTSETPTFKVDYEIKGVPVESIIQEYYANKLAEGDLDMSVALNGSGRDWSTVRNNVEGTISLAGDSLLLYGIDVDDALRKYERSQKFDLVDVGAVMLAGPLGAVVTKGSDFGKLATINFNSDKKTPLTEVIAKWRIHDGIIETEDVALTTPLNRLAFVGQIDFVNDTIPGYTVYVLDQNGCSLMDQRIYGKMNDIQIGKLKIAKTLFGSVINFVNAAVGKDCKPVYTGSMQHPNSKK